MHFAGIELGDFKGGCNMVKISIDLSEKLSFSHVEHSLHGTIQQYTKLILRPGLNCLRRDL